MRRTLLLTPLLFACARSPTEAPVPAADEAAAPTTAPAETESDRASSAARSGLPADIFDGDPMYPRLEEAARAHAEDVVERLALSDIAFPDNPQEAVDLQGYTIAMITATTHIADELPPTRVYTDCGGEIFELRVILSRVIPFETGWSEVTGRTRFDGFYLLPLQHMTLPECKLVIDWAINRSGQVITEFETEVPREVPVMPPLATPEEAVVFAMLKREYPFLFEE